MAEFLSRNPLVVLCGLLCVWPAATAAIGWWIGRNGIPLTISIKRRNNNVNVSNNDV